MVRKQEQPTTPKGVLPTLSAGFELTTRYLWLIVIPAALDFFLWIGPRLSFQTLIADLISRFPVEAAIVDPRPMLEMIAPYLNQFSYLSVTVLGVPALMAGLSPEKTPLTPPVIELNGWGAWLGTLFLFSVVGLFLAAVYFCLIAASMNRSRKETTMTRHSSLIVWIGLTWLRLVALAVLFVVLIFAILLPFSLLAGFMGLISQAIATFVLLGAFVLLISLGIFMSYTPQGMALNPRSFIPAVGESIQLFQRNFSPAILLLFLVIAGRRLLSWVLLSADSGTWVTAINILAHAYISTALIAALFIFYRDRYQVFRQEAQPKVQTEQTTQ